MLKTEAVVVTGESRMLTKWQKPVEGIIKVNFDAALDVENKKLGIGLIARNYRGEVLTIYWGTFPSRM